MSSRRLLQSGTGEIEMVEYSPKTVSLTASASEERLPQMVEKTDRLRQLMEVDEILNNMVEFEMDEKYMFAGDLADELLEDQSGETGETIMGTVKKLNDRMLERYLDGIRWFVGRS